MEDDGRLNVPVMQSQCFTIPGMYVCVCHCEMSVHVIGEPFCSISVVILVVIVVDVVFFSN